MSAPMIRPMLTAIPAEVASLSDYAPLARERMDPAVWAYVAGGAGDETTLAENEAAFARLTLRKRVLADLAGGGTATRLFGCPLAAPILVAPMAYQTLFHPDGERAMALGAAAAGLTMVAATQSGLTMEAIAEAIDAPLWFQLYVQHDRGFTDALVARAEAAGYRALVVTVDAPVSGLRNREQRAGFRLPPGVTAANLAGLPPPPPPSPEGALLFGTPMIERAPGWDDIARIAGRTALPLIVKGVLDPEDACRAIDAGAAGVIVSNHGGRVMDGVPAAIAALPAVAGAVGGRAPLLVDGGVRRGVDVLRALALGASAVLVGRPCLWGLAAAGAAGVAHVLRLLRAELELAMTMTGCRDIAAIDRNCLWEAR